MASYPSSAKTFATRSDGQSIDAAHINDLQDEVTAVEQGLLAGLAHTLKPVSNNLYDLGTTLLKWRSLFLAADAAVAGNLTVGGTSTLNGSIAVGGNTSMVGVTLTGALKLAIDTSTGTSLPTGNTNNLAIAATSNVAYISAASGSPVITGIANGVTGRMLWLINTGAVAIALGHLNAASSAANQIVCPGAANLSVRSGGGVAAFYDGSLWRSVTP